MAISVGDKAPDFTLPGTDGTEVTLSSFQGKQNVVMVFYTGDSTPGWTRQLSALRDDRAQFESRSTAILGINPGSMNSHQKFCDKLELLFPLLVDTDRSVANAYDAVKENGKSINRTVVIVDKEGTVQYFKRGMPADAELLGAIEKF